MLPECRREDFLYAVPKLDLEASEVEGFMDELRAFHEAFAPCFTRSETREHVWLYLAGRFSKLERKSIEPIALHVEEGVVRSMQRALSETKWDEERMLAIHRRMVAGDLDSPDGVLIFDESGFAKKGDESAGVARQYCGNLGKVENSQVGVFAAYASAQGYALVDAELFLPECWFNEAHKERREKCGVPKEAVFLTKPQLAAMMLKRLHGEKILAFRWVLADTVYGASPVFIAAVEARPELSYFVSAPSDLAFWPESQGAPVERKTYRRKGKKLEKTVLAPQAKKPVTALAFAKALPDTFWYRRTVSEGTKGPIVYEFARRRVILARDGLPDRTVWLVLRRTVGQDPEYRYFISNAPVSTRLATFVWLCGMRWPIEQCFEEGKSELGMDHYEMRRYAGWRHHMLVSMIAHFFLWHLKIRLGKKSTTAYGVAA